MITRRNFLGSLSAASAMLAMQRTTNPAAALTSSLNSGAADGRPTYAVLNSLAPGAVKAEGWLGLYLDKQATGLSLHLPEIARPFTGAFWAGEENYASWWPWEQKGYWTDGALRCALVTGNQDLLKLARATVDYTLSHAFPDGYLGPALIKNGKEVDPRVDNFRWPNTVFFRAIAALGEATSDPKIAAAIQKHYLSDQGAPYGGPSRDVTNVEAMLWSYARTGDQRLLAMAEESWNGFLQSAEPGDFESGDLHPDRVFANTPINAHGVTYIEKAKLPAILYIHTGNKEYLHYALAAQKRIFDHHMLIDGIPSTSEDYRGITALDSHETCDISDHTWSWGYLLTATGDSIWADRIESAVFNAGFGAIKKDWKAHQYFSCPNQFLATQNSCHAVLAHGKGWMSYRPGHTVACCSGNVHRIFPNYAIRMWMKDKKRGLAAVLYGPSTVTAQVSQSGHRVEIKQETNYPFEEEIHFTIRCEQPLTFPLSFRIPGWCSSPHLYLNDKPLPLPPIDSGFAQLNRKFHPNDRITLVLPMRTALSHWPDNGVGVKHGPLVYSLPIKEEWTSVVIPKHSTSEFPCWNAMPAGAWGYGLTVDEDRLASEIEIKRRPMTEDPWTEPPITATVSVKKISGWELEGDQQDPNQKFTPPLPDLANNSVLAQSEHIGLAPYGSTHLRLTIFPNVNASGEPAKTTKPAYAPYT